MASLRNIGVDTEALKARKAFNELSTRIEVLITNVESAHAASRASAARQGYQSHSGGYQGYQSSTSGSLRETTEPLNVIRAVLLALDGDYRGLDYLEDVLCFRDPSKRESVRIP
jgi:hypothetical protein